MRFIFGVVNFTDMKKILSIAKIGLAVLSVALVGVACSKTKVVLLVSSVSITPASLRLDEGATAELVAEMMPENATDKTIKWESSASDIVSVDKNGKISALKEGVATITAKSLGSGVSGTCEVEVLKNLASDFDPGFAKALQEKGYIADASRITREEASKIKLIEIRDALFNPDAEKLTSLSGIEYFTNLEVLEVDANELTDIDISKNLALKTLTISNNKLKSLNICNNTNLEYLSAPNNELSDIDLSSNSKLEYVSLYKNQLTEIDLSKNKSLSDLNVRDNKLTTLKLVENIELLELSAENNSLTSIDISGNTKLVSAILHHNQLTGLDVSRNTALELLQIYSNVLTSLNVSNNKKLTDLNISSNNLPSIDISSNKQLSNFSCIANSGNSNIFYVYVSSGFEIPSGFTKNGATWTRNNNTVTLKYVYR